VDDSPLASLVAEPIVLAFADEQSVVQTRFATSALCLLLTHFGWDVGASATRAEAFLGEPPEEVGTADHFVFLGRGVGAALANEAALKLREVLGAWTESYPTMEYRHGPISVASERSLVWILDDGEPSIDEEITITGARVVRNGNDPLAGLVRVHRAVQQLATKRGVDPDHPRFLARSIMLNRS
jgi:fructoselysine-6-P-deglycase FrlB-like protein